MKLSLELMDVSSQLDKWLENNDFDLTKMNMYTITGCMIYCEPDTAVYLVTRDILNNKQKKHWRKIND